MTSYQFATLSDISNLSFLFNLVCTPCTLNFGKAYEHKIDVINVITAPEIEMLIIFAENQYKEFKKSGKKTSDFCKENLRMPDVKSYDYVFNYFSDSKILVSAIKEYHRIARIPKGEYTLLDLLK